MGPLKFNYPFYNHLAESAFDITWPDSETDTFINSYIPFRRITFVCNNEANPSELPIGQSVDCIAQ